MLSDDFIRARTPSTPLDLTRDSDTFRKMYAKRRDALHFSVPLKNPFCLREFGINADSATELDW